MNEQDSEDSNQLTGIWCFDDWVIGALGLFWDLGSGIWNLGYTDSAFRIPQLTRVLSPISRTCGIRSLDFKKAE